MAPSPLKPILPRRLFWRTLAILLIPIVALQVVVGLVFFQRHYQRVTEQMTRNVAYELGYAIDQIEAAEQPDVAARQIGALALPLGFRLRLEPGAVPEPEARRPLFDVTGGTIAKTLGAALSRPMAIDLASDPRAALLRIGTRAGTLEAVIPRDRLSVSNPHQLLVLMVLSALLLTTVAVIFLRNQVRPILALAEAAEAFGKGRSLPYRPAGAEEVRRAGLAFLSMRSRLERQIEQRTQMLSGVSHDLRTPLTRMKLTLALMDETEETRDLLADVDQMERMLGEFLAFARGDGTEETVEANPFVLATGIVEDARRAGARIRLVRVDETRRGGTVALRPGAIGRAIQNLVGNAQRHGSEVVLTVRLAPRTLSFVVEDDGPGIPEADRARALQPFTRLDPARNLDKGPGNVGLGLTIALDVARSHGGTLELGGSPDLGGLRATLRIPR